MTPLQFVLKFHYLKNFPQNEPPICENLPPKIKEKVFLIKGWGRVIQLLNSKISPNYVSFISTKVKCIATLYRNKYK